MLFALLSKIRLLADLAGVGMIGVLGLLLKWKSKQLQDIKVNNLISQDKARQDATENDILDVEAALKKAGEEYLHAYNSYNSSVDVHQSNSETD